MHEADKGDVVPRFVHCSTCEQREEAQASLEEGQRGTTVGWETVAEAIARDEAESAESDGGAD